MTRMCAALRRSRDEVRATSAKRMRELRLSLGYETAASFARAIGYSPDKIRRHERDGFIQAAPMMRFVRAMEKAGLGAMSLDWLFDVGTNRMWRRRPGRRRARPVQTKGNVAYVAFGR